MQQLSLRYQLFEADEAYFQLLLAGCFEGQGTVGDDFFESLTVAIVDQMQGVALLASANQISQGEFEKAFDSSLLPFALWFAK
nr:hypothetical protein [Streptococcus equi]